MATSLWNAWDRFRGTNVPADIRAAIIGSVVSAVVSWTWAAAAREEPKEIYVFPNDAGFAQPMPLLDQAVRGDAEAISVRFEPESLREMVVCEYAYISGFSGREMLFSYLEKYPMCLSVYQSDPKAFTIRPNRRSGEMTELDGQWLCRCPTAGN